MQSTSTAQALPPAGEASASLPPAAAPTRAAWLAVLSVAVGSFALITTEFLPVGLLPSIAAGTFGITKRPADRGKGLDGVVVKAPGHLDPATELMEAR